MASETDERQVAQLIEGELGWEELRNDVLPDPKDGQRFEVTRRLLEERVEWDNPILVPINDHLYAVGSDQGRIVTCDCGHEFCSLSDNWKHHARVRVREDESEHRESYPSTGRRTPTGTSSSGSGSARGVARNSTSTPSLPATRSRRGSNRTWTRSTRSGPATRRPTGGNPIDAASGRPDRRTAKNYSLSYQSFPV